MAPAEEMGLCLVSLTPSRPWITAFAGMTVEGAYRNVGGQRHHSSAAFRYAIDSGIA